MKLTKKVVALVMACAVVLVVSTAFVSPVYARGWGGGGCCRRVAPTSQRAVPQSHQYFNVDGTSVTFTPANLWQDADGNVMFGRGCWFVDADGNTVNAWGTQVFDAEGNPVVWGGQGWGGCC